MRQPPSFQNINRPTKGDKTIESWMFINNSTQSVPPQKKTTTRKKKKIHIRRKQQIETTTLEKTNDIIGTTDAI